jgi:hypothetical protein
MAQRSDQKKDQKKSTRSTMSNPFVFVVSLLILVVITFGFVLFTGVDTGGMGVGVRSLGSYGSTHIATLANSYFMNQYSGMMEQQRPEDDFNRYLIAKEAFSNTVLHMALLDRAQELGVSVSDKAVYKQLAEYQRFQDQRGNLDLDAVRNYPEIKQLIKQIREDLLHTYMMKDLGVTSILSSAEEKFVASTYENRRAVSLVIFDQADFPEVNVIAYAQEHPEIFTQVRLAQITVEDAKLAGEIKQKLDANPASFGELAKENSIDQFRDKDGLMDPLFISDLGQYYADEVVTKQIAELKANALLGPIPQGKEFIIIKVVADPALPDFTNPNILSAVRTYMSQNEKNLIDESLSKQAEDFVIAARSSTLEGQAKSVGKLVQTSLPFAINYQRAGARDPFTVSTMYGNFPVLSPVVSLDNQQTLQGANQQEAFFINAFKLKAGEISEPVNINGQIVIMSLKNETKAEEFEQSFFNNSLNQVIRQLNAEDLRRVIVDPNKQKDNFEKGYQEWMSDFQRN